MTDVWPRTSAVSQLLETIKGVGPMSATALAAPIAEPSIFTSGCELAVRIGLVPRQNPSGGKDRLGRISKLG